jgi:hypothetical protein
MLITLTTWAPYWHSILSETSHPAYLRLILIVCTKISQTVSFFRSSDKCLHVLLTSHTRHRPIRSSWLCHRNTVHTTQLPVLSLSTSSCHSLSLQSPQHSRWQRYSLCSSQPLFISCHSTHVTAIKQGHSSRCFSLNAGAGVSNLKSAVCVPPPLRRSVLQTSDGFKYRDEHTVNYGTPRFHLTGYY